MRLLPFDFDRFNEDTVLISNVVGEISLLKNKEFKILCNEDYDWLEISRTRELLCKHFITNEDRLSFDIELLANKLRTRKDYLSGFTSLHMIVLTLKCNCMCSYCQASSKCVLEDKSYDMDEETARKTVDIIFQSPSNSIKIEFQGGEPILNFKILKYIVLYSEELNNIYKKDLSFVVCTNLLFLSDEQIRFFFEHKIDISTSCDGTKELHDFCRKSMITESAYDTFITNLNRCREVYGNNGPSALLTVTKNNLHRLNEVIDNYRNLKFNNLFIRALNPYGYAIDNINELGYSVDEFVDIYKEALKYIIDINLDGEFFVEDYASILLQRILTPFPTGFVDLQSPSGAGILGCVYYYNGNVYPTDEGRMLAAKKDETFLLGNVKINSYNEIFDGNIIRSLVKSSCLESMPVCCDCAYKHFCGSDPIRYYVESKDIIGKRYSSDFCRKNKLIIKELLRYIFMNDRNINKVFWSWITRKPIGE